MGNGNFAGTSWLEACLSLTGVNFILESGLLCGYSVSGNTGAMVWHHGDLTDAYHLCQRPGGCLLIQTCRLTSTGIPIVMIRQSHNCLIFVMEIPIPWKTLFILRQGPGCSDQSWAVTVDWLLQEDGGQQPTRHSSWEILWWTVQCWQENGQCVYIFMRHYITHNTWPEVIDTGLGSLNILISPCPLMALSWSDNSLSPGAMIAWCDSS